MPSLTMRKCCVGMHKQETHISVVPICLSLVSEGNISGHTYNELLFYSSLSFEQNYNTNRKYKQQLNVPAIVD